MAWRRLGLGAVLLAVAVAVAVSGTALRSDPGLEIQTDGLPVAGPTGEPQVVRQPPVRAGARWLCTPGHPVRAFASGRYYPPQHPAVPDDTTRPQACFVDDEWAQAAGYALAATPADAVRVGSLYVMPAAAPSVEACMDVAGSLGFAAPCPSRLPAPGRGVSCTNSCVFYGRAKEPGAVIEQRFFPLPADWCNDCEPHVVVAAAKDRTPPELVTCGPQMAIAARAGQPIAGYHDCGPGPPWLPGIAGYPHERHTLLVWEDGPVSYAVSIEGHSAQARAVLRAVRDGIQLVAPRR